MDHVKAECTGSSSSGTLSTSSTSTSTINFIREPPPHMTSGILAILYLDTDAVLDIDSTTFITTVQVSTSPNSADLEFQDFLLQLRMPNIVLTDLVIFFLLLYLIKINI